jgi:hypothetical protein
VQPEGGGHHEMIGTPAMEYSIGILVGLGACAFGAIAGFQRDRSFYPVMLVVVASYYDLFAVIGGGEALGPETAVLAFFALASLVGMRTNLWVVAAALAGHGVFDFYHGLLIANDGVPAWWPMFCLSFDVLAAAYLAQLLARGRIQAEARPGLSKRMRPYVEIELGAARDAEAAGHYAMAFAHFERAHVLGQSSTVQHVWVHVRMLLWGLRGRDGKEIVGQLGRIVGAAAKTWLGLVPLGNTGGSNVSAFKSMPIAADLAKLMASAQGEASR